MKKNSNKHIIEETVRQVGYLPELSYCIFPFYLSLNIYLCFI